MHTRTMNDVIQLLRENYGLEIEAPFRVCIDGDELQFDYHIKGYGSKKGMIVDARWEKLSAVAGTLSSLGFGYSCMQIDQYLVEDFVSVLLDWGRQDA